MHKVFQNLEVTPKTLVTRRLTWSNIHTDNTKVIDTPGKKKYIRRGDLISAIRASLCAALTPFSVRLCGVVLN